MICLQFLRKTNDARDNTGESPALNKGIGGLSLTKSS